MKRCQSQLEPGKNPPVWQSHFPPDMLSLMDKKHLKDTILKIKKCASSPVSITEIYLPVPFISARNVQKLDRTGSWKNVKKGGGIEISQEKLLRVEWVSWIKGSIFPCKNSSPFCQQELYCCFPYSFRLSKAKDRFL